MTKQFQKEIARLKESILELGTIVEESLARSLSAVAELDISVADDVVNGDERIDTMEIEIEEECLKVLALYQPVAVDLRFIVAVLKMNNDLERIGDLAQNIARCAVSLCELPNYRMDVDLYSYGEKVRRMVHDSLQALIEFDPQLARHVCKSDNEVDVFHRQMYKKVEEHIRKDNSNTTQCLMYLSISRALERIADHSTNIAEDVIYMIEGDIVRHGHKSKV